MSTIDQNLDRKKQIKKDNNIELLFSEQGSGKNANSILNDMLNSISTNDEVVIVSLDRQSRNYKDF